MISDASIANFAPVVEYMKSVPFDVSRTQLYSAAELYQGYNLEDGNYYDARIYQHYISTGKHTSSVNEAIARTLHDLAIYIAMGEFFRSHHYLRCVGVMGGHALLRTDPMFRQIVYLGKRLTEQRLFMLSGGGPGAMEATHLGAWMAGRSDSQVEDALRIMSAAPDFKHPLWLKTALEVIAKYPQDRYESLGIPTWLYGHEPSTPFATHIAKFFDNSLRENNILTLPFGGVVYAPGSAGTIQEIFQDAVQNHYLSFGFSSPMIFLGCQFWTDEVPLYPLLQKMMQNGKYKNLIMRLTDDCNEVVETLLDFQEQTKANPENFNLK